jgi:hypothetical protein
LELKFNGNSSAPNAAYAFTLTASNGIGLPAVQSFTATVSPILGIISTGEVSFNSGIY